MPTLLEVLPDPDALLALPPEELASIVLRLACEIRPGHAILLNDVEAQVNGNPPDYKGYPQGKKPDISLALSEAWNWLRVQGIVIPTGNDPWHHVSRRGKELLRTGDFKTFAQSAAFPKSLLHPSIADAAWLDLARGDFDSAIFRSMKAVEVAVRKVGGFAPSDYGVKLMSKAFHSETGPLADKTQEKSEREALAALFVGAYGYYKNPQSHRDVNVDSHREAQEIVMLASHLLRIVDERRPKEVGNA